MSNDLQCQHKDMRIVKDMLTHLQELYGEKSRMARFEVPQRFFRVKMYDGKFVNNHCLIMIKNIEELQKLGMTMDKKL